MKWADEKFRYLLIGGFILALPFLWVSFRAYLKYSEWQTAAESIEGTLFHIHRQTLKNAQNETIATHYRESSPRYLEEELESLSLMEREIETLKGHIQNYPFLSNEKYKKRLQSLENNNKILFNRVDSQTYGLFQESTEQLASSVQVDGEDLQMILGKIEGEGVQGYSPQLLVTQWILTRKKSTLGQEFFELNLKLLKREFP